MKCHALVLQTAVPWCSLWLTSTCKYFKLSNFRAEIKKQKLCVVPNICLAEIHLFSHANRLSQPCAVITLTVAHTTSLHCTALFATLLHWAIWMSAGICFELFGTFRKKFFLLFLLLRWLRNIQLFYFQLRVVLISSPASTRFLIVFEASKVVTCHSVCKHDTACEVLDEFRSNFVEV